MGKVLDFPSKTYNAVLRRVQTETGFEFKIAGTLCGHLDFCITEADGSHRTYTLTPLDADFINLALTEVTQDIRNNCLYERDQLLDK